MRSIKGNYSRKVYLKDFKEKNRWQLNQLNEVWKSGSEVRTIVE